MLIESHCVINMSRNKKYWFFALIAILFLEAYFITSISCRSDYRKFLSYLVNIRVYYIELNFKILLT